MFPDRVGVVDDARIVVVHSVDVGPYLHFVRVDRRAHQRRAVIAAAASEVVDFASVVRTDETLRHVESILVGRYRSQRFPQTASIYFPVFVGHHEVGRV